MWHKVKFYRNIGNENSEIFFCFTDCRKKAKERAMTYYLPTVGGEEFFFV